MARFGRAQRGDARDREAVERSGRPEKPSNPEGLETAETRDAHLRTLTFQALWPQPRDHQHLAKVLHLFLRPLPGGANAGDQGRPSRPLPDLRSPRGGTGGTQLASVPGALALIMFGSLRRFVDLLTKVCLPAGPSHELPVIRSDTSDRSGLYRGVISRRRRAAPRPFRSRLINARYLSREGEQ